jgi:hypothetical protein
LAELFDELLLLFLWSRLWTSVPGVLRLCCGFARGWFTFVFGLLLFLVVLRSAGGSCRFLLTFCLSALGRLLVFP